jgi:Ca-activated chloride channel family protein
MFARTLTLTAVAALLLAHPPGHDTPVETAVSLTGVVRDGETGSALVGAQLFIEGTSLGTLSASDGRYVLHLGDGWAGRDAAVIVQRVGYAQARHELEITDGANVVDFALAHVGLSLDEIVVTGRRDARREADAPASNRGLSTAVERRATADDLAAAARPAIEAEALTAPADARTRVLASPAHPGIVGGLSRSAVRASANGESYARIEESGFRSVSVAPLSTFSIDVDRASYSNVRRFLESGTLPPVDAVRIEELINYFPYDDPRPTGSTPFSVTAEVAPAPWQPRHHLVRIGLKGREVDLDDAPASNLVFLIDVSGSMQSPDKLPLLKTAFEMLVDRLRPEDRVAIVVYAGAAGLVLPSTPGSERETIRAAIRNLQAGGSTAGGAGIRLAYSVAARSFIEGGNNRVILATDGDFNVGASSDADMVRLIEEKRDRGTFLTVLGFGTGNLQDAKMEQIADHGNGSFAYIDGELEAKKVLVSELGGTLFTIAKDVKIQVEFNPERVSAYRLIGYENRALATEDFNDDRKDAGELGAGHSVTALYEVVPVGVEGTARGVDVDPMRYQRNRRGATVESNEILFVKLRYKQPEGDESRLVTRAVGDVEAASDTSDDFRFSAAVAAWGMLLRESEHVGDYALNDVSRLARGALGPDLQGYRADFLTLVDRSRALQRIAHGGGYR